MAKSYIPAEMLAAARGTIVEHLVQEGFVDMPTDRRTAYGQLIFQQFMQKAVPAVEKASRAARAAGTSDRTDAKRVAASMEALCAVAQDALRECGLDIEIVSMQVPEERRG